jgi:aspartyl-tRNA(Asn)/glutamyl-tRNA(Gln) amidotransferase subunit A
VSRYLTITDAAAALAAGEVSSLELAESAIAVADALDSDLGMFLDRFVDPCRIAAIEADRARERGDALGPLHGIPLAIKDNISAKEGVSTAQSLVLDPEWSDGDAVAVARLRGAGGLIMGKATTMEFAIGAPDVGKPFPVPKNPYDVERWAGGSSSGCGSAVATGAALGGIGTDTAGSIRVPAAFCGVSGLMPTFGRVPKSGCVPLGYSLDRVGPIARSARDCALMLGVLAGRDPSDMTSIDISVPDYVGALTGDLSGMRVGVDRLSRVSGAGADPALSSLLEAAISVLESLGAQVEEVELPYYDEMVAAATVIMGSEALAYHMQDLQTRWSDYGAGTRVQIGSGVFYSAADYVQAQRARRSGQAALAGLFEKVDLIITPTSSAEAITLKELNAMIEGIGAEGDGSAGFGPLHTPYWNATGNPVLSVPIGLTANGLPLGMQIAGRPFDEAAVLEAGDAFQRDTNWHLNLPPSPVGQGADPG